MQRSVTRRAPTTDPHILRVLLGLHAVTNPRILDASYGHGAIWRGLPYRPTRLDVRTELDVDVVGSWCDLVSLFPPASFDVVVWDPPHFSDAGQGIVGAASWGDRYGESLPKTDNIASLDHNLGVLSVLAVISW